jgi:hypothetical protein
MQRYALPVKRSSELAPAISGKSIVVARLTRMRARGDDQIDKECRRTVALAVALTGE